MTERSDSDDSRPTVVVAGGTGLIGRRLCAELGAGGAEVIVLTRSSPPPPVGPVRFVQWRGTEPAADETWPACLEGAHAVINLCGEPIGGPRWTARRKALLIGSRVTPSRALVTASNRCSSPPRAFLQASGVGYYGTGDAPRSESSGPGEDFLAELAKRWEAPLGDLDGRVRAVALRLGVVLAAHDGALRQMLLPFRLFVGGPVAGGHQWLSWIHLHDAARAVIALIDWPDAAGPYNLTAPEPVRNVEFARAAGQALHRPTWMFTPRFVLNALLGEQATLICDGQQVRPERLLDAGFRFEYPELAGALQSLAP
jgi:uncharacterized protein (TIGR01777 family)